MNSRFVRLLKHNPLVHALILGTSIIVCYYGLWQAYFTSDDYWMLGWVRHHQNLSDAVWAQFGYGVRFLLDAHMWVRVKLFDLNASPYYWVSLLQHIIVTIIVYWLIHFWTRRRLVAFISALLFGTTFSHYTVITWITGSEYSQATILYLGTLACFAFYLQQREIWWYVGSLIAFVMLLLFLELSLSLPLVLVAYHLIKHCDFKLKCFLTWPNLRLYIPFGVLFVIYLALQFVFVQSGSSEATVATQSYEPGLHMISNLYYLAYLIIPNVHYRVLADFFGPAVVEVVRWLTLAIAVAGNLLAVYGLWRGSALVRFAIAFVYLTFLPYTLWGGRFAGAIRYMYLPSITFSLLLGLGLVWLHDLWHKHKNIAYRLSVPAVVTVFLIINIAVVQMWVQRHVENSAVRRTFVTQLAANYGDVKPGTTIYIEVPADKFIDLREACTLIFPYDVSCKSFVSGSLSPADIADSSADQPIYWLRVTPDGLNQCFLQSLKCSSCTKTWEKPLC